MEDLDQELRQRLFGEFVRTGRAPSAAQLAEWLQAPLEQIRASLERLAAGKAIVLQPESRDILMANPLCAVPTPFLVRAGDQSFFGSCVWDALGIIAMLGRDATLETSCHCCGEALTIEVREGRPLRENGIIHFAIPAKRWWENIVFT
jgi:hypothetical protein